MYQRIYVPVDNSDYSNRAVDAALELAQAFQSKLTGCHVYAASMHDYRFKQMEYTLPEEYLDEITIEHCGKSRVYLGGLAQTLHERNLRALLKHMRERELSEVEVE